MQRARNARNNGAGGGAASGQRDSGTGLRAAGLGAFLGGAFCCLATGGWRGWRGWLGGDAWYGRWVRGKGNDMDEGASEHFWAGRVCRKCEFSLLGKSVT